MLCSRSAIDVVVSDYSQKKSTLASPFIVMAYVYSTYTVLSVQFRKPREPPFML